VKLAEIYTEAGVPAGVFNVAGPAASRAVADRAPGIEKMSFTGGVATGKKVMASAASSSLKEVTMELGGKSPLVICDDADLDRAADIAVMANFFSSGQVCTNGTRVFVPRSMQGRVRPPLSSASSASASATRWTPTPTSARWSASRTWKTCCATSPSGKAEGARLLTGGGRATEGALANGAYVLPTVFSDCRDDMTIVKEEIFGPVMSILAYDDEDEVMRRANDTTFGLAAGVVSKDVSRAHASSTAWKPASAGSTPGANRRPKCRSAATSNPASAARTASRPSATTPASSRCRSSWATTPACSDRRAASAPSSGHRADPTSRRTPASARRPAGDTHEHPQRTTTSSSAPVRPATCWLPA
jgi:hypothetical protein